MQPIAETFGKIVERNDEFPFLPKDQDKLTELLGDSRCVIFRGFQASIEDFEEITAAVTSGFLTYQGGGFTVGPFSRSKVNNNSTLLTATGNTQDFALPLHGEMYYLQQPPDLIWFYCAIPVSEGGETTLGDGVKILSDMPETTAKMLIERGIRYERRLADGDWQTTFQTDDKSAVEEFCRAQKMELSWDEEGSAVTCFRTSAVRYTADGQPAFINSLLLLALGERAIREGKLAKYNADGKVVGPDFVVRWDDGSPVEPQVLKDIAAACGKNEVEVAWQQGDIILVDNRSVMHGRRGSTMAGRKILVRMGNLVESSTRELTAA